jgi:predicted O-methyltransferase YrrM
VKDFIIKFPEKYPPILEETEQTGFNQLSDEKAGALLSVLCASKPQGKFLELGTGSGLSTSWMLEGMCSNSNLTTVDNDGTLVAIAKKHLGNDLRVKFIVGDGEKVISEISSGTIDLVFADTWPGKYNHLDETIALLKPGGVYVIDDMMPQSNWPEGHDKKASTLINYLSNRTDLSVVKLCWSTGLIICAKNA